MAGNTSQPSIKRVWGIAKSPELKLTDEELHLLVQAHTGKDSIKALNKRELQTVIRVLGNMKDSAKKSERGRNRYSGSEVTENQRKKIYKLTSWMPRKEQTHEYSLQEDDKPRVNQYPGGNEERTWH